MLRNLLKLSAAAPRCLLLCRGVVNSTKPTELLQRSYANKCPLEAVYPEDPDNKLIVYRYPMPRRKSAIRLMQEANELLKRRQSVKCEEESTIQKENDCKATANDCVKEEVKSDLKRRSWQLLRNLSEAKEPQRLEDDSDQYIVTEFQKFKFNPNVPYRRRTETEGRIKYEKVSATVRMFRRGNKSS